MLSGQEKKLPITTSSSKDEGHECHEENTKINAKYPSESFMTDKSSSSDSTPGMEDVSSNSFQMEARSG